MISLQTYVRRGQAVVHRWALDPGVHTALRIAAHVLAGLCMSAASIAGKALPLAMGLTCGCTGWPAFLVAFGSAAGYLLFWGRAGYQAAVWVGIGLVATVLLADRRLCRDSPLLLPAVSSLIVAVCGVILRTAVQDVTTLLVYLLRVVLAFGSTWLFSLVTQRRNPILDWIACALAVFALAQIMPIPYLGLGYIAAAALTSAASFPAAALAGLALDLAQVTRIPMAAVMTLGYLIRFLPRYPPWLGRVAPAAVYMGVMSLVGVTDLLPLPGLLLGGFLGSFLPLPGKASHRRGETGVAQVRLEVAAGVLSQTRQLLLEMPPMPVDEDALVNRAAERACGSCPYRKSCKDARRIGQLPGTVLQKPLQQPEELPIVCRKSGRFLGELRRSQEQLRAIRADRQRQSEYRGALMQQYQFLSEFLQELSDQLTRRGGENPPVYAPHVEVYGNRPEADNGDKCLRFSGPGGRYYVVLCDGMGTGMGAIQESRTAGTLLRRLLTAGYPASHALRSLNSICALRDRAGAVTVDLAEVYLDTGKTVLYKWGAAPSYLISKGGVERIGEVNPPPGLSVTEARETMHRVTLRRNQILVLVSDGITQEDALRGCTEGMGEANSELAARLLSRTHHRQEDDATVVLIHLTVEEI